MQNQPVFSIIYMCLLADLFRIVLKNKYAQVVVLLFSNTYPQDWPDFFDELVALPSSGLAAVDMFFRICAVIDEEIVCKYVLRSQIEVARNTLIVGAIFIVLEYCC